MKPINNDIKKAITLDKSFYQSAAYFEAAKEKIFARSWQWLCHQRILHLDLYDYAPIDLLNTYLDEPLLITKNKEGVLQCLSNVCTHRGFILADQPGSGKLIQCKYHGRCFRLDGFFKSMPGFEEAENFPSASDNLHQVPMVNWKDFLFVSLNPAYEWSSVDNALNTKLGFLKAEEFRFAEEYNKEYLVKANWALYVENYLEGFHVPFVHDQSFKNMFDYNAYTTELFDYCNVQIGYANESEYCFDFPEGHVDYGKKVAAYYFWLFPNMMLNVYPYGIQINIVKPITVNRCKVQFLFYLKDEEIFREMNADALAAKVEREDEWVVEGVQRGLASRFYRNGRLSPKHETGVHHFHRLVYRFLNE